MIEDAEENSTEKLNREDFLRYSLKSRKGWRFILYTLSLLGFTKALIVNRSFDEAIFDGYLRPYVEIVPRQRPCQSDQSPALLN